MTAETSHRLNSIVRLLGVFVQGVVVGLMLNAVLFQGVSIVSIVTTATEISDEIGKLIASLVALVTVGLTAKATLVQGYKSSDASQIARVDEIARVAEKPEAMAAKEVRDRVLTAAAATPGVEGIVAPSIAKEVPSDKVVAEWPPKHAA